MVEYISFNIYLYSFMEFDMRCKYGQDGLF